MLPLPTDKSFDLDTLTKLLCNNKTSIRTLRLRQNQLSVASSQQMVKFIKGIDKTTTLHCLDLSTSGNQLSDEHLSALIEVLEDNNCLTSIYFEDGLYAEEQLREIEKILRRNKSQYFKGTILPKQVPILNKHFAKVRTFAFAATAMGDLDLLYTLIKKYPKLLCTLTTNTMDYTLLHMATRFGQIECAKMLIEQGANVNWNNTEKDTGIHKGASLHIAIQESNIVIAELLLINGADVHSRKEGKTALHSVNNPRLASLLISNGADVNAVCGKSLDVKSHGNRVLHSIVQAPFPHPGVVKLLIEAGADVNATNSMSRTPLHLLVCNNKQTVKTFRIILNQLLQAGAKPQAKSIHGKEGLTPYDLAVKNKFVYLEMLKQALIDYQHIKYTAKHLRLEHKDKDSRLYNFFPSEIRHHIACMSVDSDLLEAKTRLSLQKSRSPRRVA